MEQEVNLEVIKTTQNTLGKHLKKPPLTDKLLKKPPFRFLHDIVTSVLKSTGFFEGLFDEDELISENVKDRESKIAFLNKVITVLVTATGKSITVKPSKVVAGQEPEKTNELLQLLAEALDRKLSSSEAVQKFRTKSSKSTNKHANLKDEKVPDKNKKDDETNKKKLVAKSSEKLTTQKNLIKNEKTKLNIYQKSQEEEAKGDFRETKARKDVLTKKTTAQSKVLTKKPEKIPQKEKPLKSSNSTTNINIVTVEDAPDNTNTYGDVTAKPNDNTEKVGAFDAPPSVQVQLNTSYTITEKELNLSASSNELQTNEVGEKQPEYIENDGQSKAQEENKANAIKEPDIADTVVVMRIENSTGDENTSKKDSVNRNSEDYSRTQVIHENNKVRPQSTRPSSSRPGAPRVRDKHESILAVAESNLVVGKVNIIAENTQNEEEEDTGVLIVNQNSEEETAESLQLSSNPRGHLVQQILESQKEYTQSGKTEIEWQFGAHRAREALHQEIEEVRFNIQALSRVANPLGKLLDHIQEDVEVMRQELLQWQQSYEESSQLLSKQKLANDDSLQPLHTKIKKLEVDILDKHEKINDLKVVIHKNALRIDKLLESDNVQ